MAKDFYVSAGRGIGVGACRNRRQFAYWRLDNHSHDYGGNHGHPGDISNTIILHPRGSVLRRAEAAMDKSIPIDRAVVANHLTDAADLLSCAIGAYRRCLRLAVPRG